MTKVQVVVAVLVFCCALVLAVQALERHEIMTGRTHRLLRLRPAFGVPAAAPVLLAVPPALVALAITDVSSVGGILFASVVATITGWASLVHRKRKAAHGPDSPSRESG